MFQLMELFPFKAVWPPDAAPLSFILDNWNIRAGFLKNDRSYRCIEKVRGILGKHSNWGVWSVWRCNYVIITQGITIIDPLKDMYLLDKGRTILAAILYCLPYVCRGIQLVSGRNVLFRTALSTGSHWHVLCVAFWGSTCWHAFLFLVQPLIHLYWTWNKRKFALNNLFYK